MMGYIDESNLYVLHENKFDSCNSYLFSAADLGCINDNVECVNSEIFYKYENRGYERTS